MYASHEEVLRERSLKDVGALLSGTSGIGIDKDNEEIKVKDCPNKFLLDMTKAAIRYARRIGPDDDEKMGNINHAF